MRTSLEIGGVTAFAVLCWHALDLWMLLSGSQGLPVGPWSLATATSMVAGLVVLVGGARWLGRRRALQSPRLVGAQFAFAGFVLGGTVSVVRLSLVDIGVQTTAGSLVVVVVSEAVVDAALSLVSGLAGVPLGAMAAGDESSVMEAAAGESDADARRSDTTGADP